MKAFFITSVMLCAIVVAGCTPGEEIMRSERAQDGLWKLVDEELVQSTSEDARKKWAVRIPRIRLENQRRAAALAGDDFDMEAAIRALGIKKRDEIIDEMGEYIKRVGEVGDGK